MIIIYIIYIFINKIEVLFLYFSFFFCSHQLRSHIWESNSSWPTYFSSGFHFPLYHLSIWAISWWNLSPCSSETNPKFSGKISKWEMKEMQLKWHIVPQSSVICKQFFHMILIVFQISYFLKTKLLQTFWNASHALFSVSFKLSLELKYLKSCLICGPNDNSFFLLSLTYYGNFPFK